MIAKFKTLSKKEAEEALDGWIRNGSGTPKTESEYTEVREKLLQMKDSAGKHAAEGDYCVDIHFGALLYEYLNGQTWFSTRTASDDGFWRYLSVMVVPDIVSWRWKENLQDHTWKKSNRIWLKVLWWYYHLSLKENCEKTLEMLSGETFNTDIILNLVERTGKKGTYVEVFRKIMYYYSRVSKTERNRYNKSMKSSSETLFRSLMKLNTVRLLVMDPILTEGGPDGYVRTLFETLHINVE